MGYWIWVDGTAWQVKADDLERMKDLAADAISREGVQSFDVLHDGKEAILLLNGRTISHLVLWQDPE